MPTKTIAEKTAEKFISYFNAENDENGRALLRVKDDLTTIIQVAIDEAVRVAKNDMHNALENTEGIDYFKGQT